MANARTLNEIVELTKQLSLLDKVRMVEEIDHQIEGELKAFQPRQRVTLRGLWKGLDITEEDIAEVRNEMWSDFPRKDV
jgi:predicted phage-related endonuclease